MVAINMTESLKSQLEDSRCLQSNHILTEPLKPSYIRLYLRNPMRYNYVVRSSGKSSVLFDRGKRENFRVTACWLVISLYSGEGMGTVEIAASPPWSDSNTTLGKGSVAKTLNNLSKPQSLFRQKSASLNYSLKKQPSAFLTGIIPAHTF